MSMSTSSSRKICPTCLRPQKVCLCQWIQPIDNALEVGILQHPSEASQIKGTAKIAQLSLINSQLWVGEAFSQTVSLHEWLKTGEVFLLYPEIEALKERRQNLIEGLSYSVESAIANYSLSQMKLLVLDGTWRKTHKMMMQNTFLHGLKRLQLQPESPSAYQIRKQKDSGSLSTIEAIYQALMQLEQDSEKFEPLIHAFHQMVAQQLAFRSNVSPQA